ncbi:MAG: hypothetical protein EB141_17065 [Verrucomicrobia bacterium]|nr:hypothetical protein [Verrucomicrobiota bacterium]NBU11653.1 hypothetical protein [Pseudomonadota bacterium]NDA68564.1 hypothetical protein [Verrucomicrobiota bacterium]NDB77322.1 hypothetical protein [Verrucomicrobiota bacterium]NDD40283.1 hypothetical protein [Verrucomicrobiota bacterium]
MRNKVHPSKRAKPRAISLLPHQEKYASKRAFDAQLSFSKYVSVLIELDRQKNILAQALTAGLKTN